MRLHLPPGLRRALLNASLAFAAAAAVTGTPASALLVLDAQDERDWALSYSDNTEIRFVDATYSGEKGDDALEEVQTSDLSLYAPKITIQGKTQLNYCRGASSIFFETAADIEGSLNIHMLERYTGWPQWSESYASVGAYNTVEVVMGDAFTLQFGGSSVLQPLEGTQASTYLETNITLTQNAEGDYVVAQDEKWNWDVDYQLILTKGTIIYANTNPNVYEDFVGVHKGATMKVTDNLEYSNYLTVEGTLDMQGNGLYFGKNRLERHYVNLVYDDDYGITISGTITNLSGSVDLRNFRAVQDDPDDALDDYSQLHKKIIYADLTGRFDLTETGAGDCAYLLTPTGGATDNTLALYEGNIKLAPSTLSSLSLVANGNGLAYDASVLSEGDVTLGSLQIAGAEKKALTIEGKLTAAQLDMSAGTLQAAQLELTGNVGQHAVTGGQLLVRKRNGDAGSLNTGKGLSITSTDAVHQLGNVSGWALSLGTGVQAHAESVNLSGAESDIDGTLTVANAASFDNADVSGQVVSTTDGISLLNGSQVTGTLTASGAKGFITLGDSTANGATLTATRYENAGTVLSTIRSSTVNFGSTSIEEGKLFIYDSSGTLGSTVVDGAELEIDAGRGITAELTVKNGGTLSLKYANVLGGVQIENGSFLKLNAIENRISSLNLQQGASLVMAGSNLFTRSEGITISGSTSGSGMLASYGDITVTETGSVGSTADPHVGNMEAWFDINIEGSAYLKGDVLSSNSMVSVTGLLDMEGQMNTSTLSVSSGGSVSITGDGQGTGESSALGNVRVSGKETGGTPSSLTLEKDDFTATIMVENGGALTLTEATVNGSVTLSGQGDTLHMDDATITGALSVGNQSTVTLTDENAVGSLKLDEGAILKWNEGATLTLTGEDAALIVDGASTANIDQNGLTGDIELVHGTVNLEDGAPITGDIRVDGEDAGDSSRVLNVLGSYTMDAGEELFIGNTAGGASVNVQSAGKALTAQNLTGAGEFTLSGAGDVDFAGAGSTHSANIVSTLAGTLSATAINSLGKADAAGNTGTLVLEAAPEKLLITADQSKDISLADGMTLPLSTTDAAGTQDVTLSGKLSGAAATLALESASLTLSNAANALEAVTVDAASTLTTLNGGDYGSVTNKGIISMSGADIGSLTNDSASSELSRVSQGTLGAVDNKQGKLSITGTTLADAASISNAGTLTLSGLTHATEAPAGALTNQQSATLRLEDCALRVTSSSLAGTATLKNATLTSSGRTEVSGALTMQAASGGCTPQLRSGAEGTSISGSVQGGGLVGSAGAIRVEPSGSIGSASAAFVGNVEAGSSLSVAGSVHVAGHVSAPDATNVSGQLSVQGSVSTASLSLTAGGRSTIQGDGCNKGTSSSLGSVNLSGADADGKGSSLLLAADDFLADVNAGGGCSVSLNAAALSGELIGSGASVELLDSSLEGELNLADGTAQEGALTLSGSNTLEASRASRISVAMSGTGSLSKTGEPLTLSGADETPSARGGYTIHVAGGSLLLENTQRNGTLSAADGAHIIVSGGESSIGSLALRPGTQVTIREAGTDILASSSSELLHAGQAQLTIDSFATDPLQMADGEQLLLARGIQGFDPEIRHGLDTRNVNLSHEGENSYAAVSINHKGANKNAFEQGVSEALVSAEATAEGRLDEVMTALSHTGSEKDSLAALNSLGSPGAVSLMAAQMDSSLDHLRTLRGAMGHPQAYGQRSLAGDKENCALSELWVMATGASADREAGGLAPGYTRHEAGFLLGAERAVCCHTLLGLSAGYSRAEVNSGSMEMTGDVYYVDLYARQTMGRFTHSATMGVGVFDWEGKRSVYVKTAALYPDFVGTGRGEAQGLAFNASYEASYDFLLTENQRLAPVFLLECSVNQLDDYTEGRGDLGAAGLRVEMDERFTARAAVGLRYSYAFEGVGSSNARGLLSAHALFVGDMGDVKATASSRFMGGERRFASETEAHSRVGALLGVDALLPVSEHWAVFGNANLELREDYRDISAGAGVRYRF